MNFIKINRELSWLQFNERVLQEANDDHVPLLERFRFLGIFSNNLDEFFRVRVASVRNLAKIETISQKKSKNSYTFLLNQINSEVLKLQNQFDAVYSKINKLLKNEHIYFVDEKSVSKSQIQFLEHYFYQNIIHELMPVLITDKGFPILNDKSIYLFVKLNLTKIITKYAIVEVPTEMHSRFIFLPEEHENQNNVIYLDDVIRLFLPQIFKTLDVVKFESYIIKITRDSELSLDDDISESYFEKMEKSLLMRKKGEPVRFVHDKMLKGKDLEFVLKRLKITNKEAIISGGKYHNFKDFIRFPHLNKTHLNYPLAKTCKHKLLEKSKSLFKVINKEDILIHFPYQKFSYILDLINEAAIDYRVKTIKITLYRLAQKSKIINALINAAKNGKQVVVIIELQARFDEEANLNWSKKLTDEGVRVIFGLNGLKIHSKIILIQFKDATKNHAIAVVGTGNFNETTAKLYTDMAIMTADKKITLDVEKVFNLIQKPYQSQNFNHLLVSPIHMRKKLIKLIHSEVKNHQFGFKSGIKLKINNLMDEQIVNELYLAAVAGVPVQIFVRGTCAMIPKGHHLEHKLIIKTMIDKYLEHSRFLIFQNQKAPLYYISSADIMTRSLDYRIEVAIPIFEKKLQTEIDMYFELLMNEHPKSRIINENLDNAYVNINSKNLPAQNAFYNYICHKNSV